MYNTPKKIIYISLDDSVINYSETIINILNEKYGLNKTYKDLKDKDFRSIYKNLSTDELHDIITSDLFWENITVLDEFNKFYFKFKDIYQWYIVEQDINKKCKLRDDFIKNIGIDVIYDYLNEFDAESGTIHMHTNSANLFNSKAKLKILLKNGYDKPWNKTIYNIDDLYILNDWNDVNLLLQYL